jgi:hypothetical protein
MVSEAQTLREQADRCRRLAQTTLDERMEKALREYATDVEEKAALLEGGRSSTVLGAMSRITTCAAGA